MADRRVTMSDLDAAGRKRTQSIVDLADAVTVQRFLDGVRFISARTDPFECSEEAIRVACGVLKCDRASMFYVDEDAEDGAEIVLFAAKGADKIRLKVGQGIAGHVAASGEVLNIPDAYFDERFDRGHDLASGYRTKGILCAPVKDADGRTVGVLQAINKLAGGPFTKTDTILVENLASHIGVALRNAQLFDDARASRDKTAALLEIVKLLHSDSSPQSVMFTLTHRSHQLVDADRCSLYLLDAPKRELVVMQGDIDVRFSMALGVAGDVATRGVPVSIADAYEDARFNQDFDKASGYRTRQILAVPIFGAQRAVIGVLQVINHEDGTPFSADDQELLETLLSIAGPIIERSNVLASFAKRSAAAAGGDSAEGVAALSREPSDPAGAAPMPSSSLPSLTEE